jgi:hypothetical protein
MFKKAKPILAVLLFCLNIAFAQGPVVNNKGTKIILDSSKWKITGSDIINKNTGNIGIGIGTPLFKLDVFSLANPLRLTGLQNGASTDSLLISQNGVIKRLAPINSFIINRPDSTTASNGLNLFGKDVRFGGNLTQATTITNNGNALTFVTGGNPFNITGLITGAPATDSLMVLQNGLVRKIAPLNSFLINRPDSTTASNGLSLVGKDVQLGGNLTQKTTITSNGNPLSFITGGTPLIITGLTTGASSIDSLVVVQNGLIKKIAPLNSFLINRPDSTTASNGLNLIGKDVQLGGNLTQATTITNNGNALTFATGGTALNITGLNTGTSATDSLVVVQNGLVKKIAPINSFLINRPDSTTASNGLNLVGKDVRFGGLLTQATTITNNGNALTFATGGTPLNITGLPTGAATDSLVVLQNGLVRKIAPINSFILNRPDSTTASNGLNLVGKEVRLGGNLTQATTVTNNGNALTFATGGTALNITGLTTGAATDSILIIQNGLVRKLAPINSFLINRPDSTTASSGLNLVGKDVQLGGNLSQATTITNNGNALTFATGGTALNITGLTIGAPATDSLMVLQNGLVKKIAPINSFLINRPDSTTASNGLNLVGKDVRLGGNLTQATTVTNNGNALTFATGGSALNITGLPTGVATDSILVLQNGLVRKIAPLTIVSTNRPDSTTASNGLNLVGKDVRLGGNLTQATTVTNNGNALTFATAGTALNITGLPSAANTDSVVMINNATGQLRKTPVSELKEKIIERYDAAGTQILGAAYANINFNTTTIIDNGYVAGTGLVTIQQPGVYKIIAMVSARGTAGSGAEFHLVLNGIELPGSLGYTAHQGTRPNGTVTIVNIVNVTAANSTVAVQGRVYIGGGTISLIANASTFLIEKLR